MSLHDKRKQKTSWVKDNVVSVAPAEHDEGGSKERHDHILHNDLQMQVFPSLPIL